MRRLLVIAAVLLFPLVSCIGCGDDSEGPTDPTVATEEWMVEIDAGVGNGDWTLKLKKSGSVKVDGNWDYEWNTIPVECPFADGNVTISGADMSFTATGVATVTLAGATTMKTETIPIAIFLNFESVDISSAIVFIVLLIIVSFAILLFVRKTEIYVR